MKGDTESLDYGSYEVLDLDPIHALICNYVQIVFPFWEPVGIRLLMSRVLQDKRERF